MSGRTDADVLAAGGTPELVAAIVAADGSVPPVYAKVTALFGAAIVVVESARVPVVSEFVRVIGEPYAAGPTIIFPSMSFAVTVTGTLVGPTSITGTDTARLATTPLTATLNVNGVPIATVCDAEPVPSTLPLPFAPS